MVPPKSIEPGGVAQNEPNESALETMQISGLQRLKPAYVRDRVQRAVQVPLAPAQLVEGLQLLQLDPLIATLNVNLTAGSRLGSSILEIEILEAPPMSAALEWNNARSPSVGTEQTVGTVTHRNLLGYGDTLSVAIGRTAGRTTLENLSYVWPLNARGDELSVRHQRSHNEIIEAPFDLLAITSRSRRTEVGYRQLLVKTPKQEWAIGAIATWQTSQTFLGLGDIGGFPLTPGANEEGRTAIAALRLFTEFSARSASAAWALRSQLSIGFAGERQPRQPNSRFVTLRTQAQYLRRLGSQGLFLLRTDWQWTPDDLLSLEEFSLGGATTVRGYRQGELVGDKGLWVSAEIRWPIAQIPEWSAQLEVVPFLDWGWVWDVESTATPAEMNEFLAALGMGFALRLGQNFQAQLDWGVPLVERSRGSSWQENGFHLRLNYGF
jgi:hemolysin activation/secretion protein